MRPVLVVFAPPGFDQRPCFVNGAVFKRLGFLLAQTKGDVKLLDALGERLTTGNAKLDPALPCRRLVTKWRLWIPKAWEAEAATRD